MKDYTKINKKDRDVLEIIGLSYDDYLELQKTWGKNFSKRFNRTSGRIRTLNRMITQREEKIIPLEEEIKSCKEELKQIQSLFSPMIKTINPTIQLKKPRKNYPYWKGRVWWNMGYNDRTMRFNTKGRRIDFHICSEKERKEMNYSIDDMKEIGVRKFRQRILNQDFGILKPS